MEPFRAVCHSFGSRTLVASTRRVEVGADGFPFACSSHLPAWHPEGPARESSATSSFVSTFALAAAAFAFATFAFATFLVPLAAAAAALPIHDSMVAEIGLVPF